VPSGRQSPDFRQVERLRQELQTPVGLDGGEAEIVVKFGDIGPLDLAHSQVANPIADVCPEVIAIAVDRARLAVMGGVLVDDAASQVVDDQFGAGFLAGAGRVLAVPDAAENLDRFSPGFLRSENAMQAEAHAPELPADPVLNQVGALAARQDAGPEAGHLAVKDDVVLVPDLGRLDQAFGDPGHGAGASVRCWFRLTRCGPPIIHGLTMDT